MKKTYRVLVADDNIGVLNSLKLMLKVHHFDVITVTQPHDVLKQARKGIADIALIDLNYHLDTTSGQEGLSLIKEIKKLDSDLPIVVMTGWGTIDIAVEAMKNGAADLIQKPWENENLLHILNTQLQLMESIKKQRSLKRQNTLLQQQLHPFEPQDMIIHSKIMKDFFKLLEQVITSDASILLTGENGTGKSVLANYIHQRSLRREQSFVSVNMGCIPDNLFESEMFGHVQGAFTDAKQQRIGRFELADGGTLFLDEIANTPLNQQAKLLRILEERTFEKIGSSKTQLVDVRIISATNSDVSEMINGGRFRQDLYYRLNTFELRVPALRERLEDIEPLAQRMLKNFAEKYRKPLLKIMPDTLCLMQRYQWPGNIRELNHILERAVLLGSGELFDMRLLKMVLPEPLIEKIENVDPLPIFSQSHTLEDIEQSVLKQRLQDFSGNANDAAESLGLSRSAFYRRLKKSD